MLSRETCTLLLVFIFWGELAFAQQDKNHKFYILATSLQSLNKKDDVYQVTERFVGEPLPPYLTVKNATGLQLEAQYEYKTKQNYLLSLGIQLGTLRREHTYDFTFDHYRDGYDFSSLRQTFTESKQVSHAALSAMVGYHFEPFKKNKLAFQFKTGLAYIRFFDFEQESKLHSAVYKIKDSVIKSPFAFTETFGRRSAIYYTFYFGASYLTGAKLIKEYRVGVSITHAFSGLSRDNDYVDGAHALYYNAHGDIMAGSIYYNRFRNIAFTLGIGF